MWTQTAVRLPVAWEKEGISKPWSFLEGIYWPLGFTEKVVSPMMLTAGEGLFCTVRRQSSLNHFCFEKPCLVRASYFFSSSSYMSDQFFKRKTPNFCRAPSDIYQPNWLLKQLFALKENEVGFPLESWYSRSLVTWKTARKEDVGVGKAEELIRTLKSASSGGVTHGSLCHGGPWSTLAGQRQ